MTVDDDVSTSHSNGETERELSEQSINNLLAVQHGLNIIQSQAKQNGSSLNTLNHHDTASVTLNNHHPDSIHNINDINDYVKIFNGQILRKLIHLLSIITVIVVAYGVLCKQWIIPYYYTVATPVLIAVRIFMFVKLKWHFFLLDFCYFCNTLILVYIWACPYHPVVFSIVFGMANGPLVTAIAVFRNSLVFHDIDKLISTYIHVLPPLLSYCIRWYPEMTSKYWYTDFVHVFILPSFVWLVAVPLGCFMFHGLVYLVIVRLIINPGEEYIDAFRFLTSKENTWVSKMLNIAGPKGRIWLFMLYNWIVGLISTLFTLVWYDYHIAHCILLCLMVVIVTWNGGTFYLDVFGKSDNNRTSEKRTANVSSDESS